MIVETTRVCEKAPFSGLHVFYSTDLCWFYMMSEDALVCSAETCFNTKKQSYAVTSVFLDQNTALLHSFTVV